MIDLFPNESSDRILTGSIEVKFEFSVALFPRSTSSQFTVHSISSSPPRQSTKPSHLSENEMHLLPPQTQVWPGQCC